MSLLPSRLEVSPSPDEPKVLDIDGEGADAAFDALGSETARKVLAAIYDEPRTPTEVRESVGTSLQNVHYHLDRLENAGLIEPAGMGYSEKGNEMTVYGPASEAVVLFAGRDNDSSRLRNTLQRLFGLFFVVSLSTLVFAAVSELLRPEVAPQPRSDDVGMMAESQSAADAATSSVAALDPLLAFFLGGCVVVAALGLVWGIREYRARKTASA
ncbi:winged helix-turn-helix domain-containing protein [Natronomonas gomsonensis]|uniref:ArsR/SmtB family transcription factor n=1 Tax=Natronomonas gomsonensis TaxID=1046043 RepID=UPI0015BBE3FC|nr:winged helix-turn-helix domain-containing protein [Natronomonas gomsonensis]